MSLEDGFGSQVEFTSADLQLFEHNLGGQPLHHGHLTHPHVPHGSLLVWKRAHTVCHHLREESK